MAAQYGNDIGALCPSYDKPEQGLDILQDAITSLELTPGEDFFIALNLAGKEIFDYVGSQFYENSWTSFPILYKGSNLLIFFSCMFFAKRYIYIIVLFYQISGKEINLYQVHFS